MPSEQDTARPPENRARMKQLVLNECHRRGMTDEQIESGARRVLDEMAKHRPSWLARHWAHLLILFTIFCAGSLFTMLAKGWLWTL